MYSKKQMANSRGTLAATRRPACVRGNSRLLATACALALSSGAAIAQDAAKTGDTELEEIIVTGSQILLPNPFAGGQVAEGGRAGILGNLDTLETPFSSTNYTEELMRNQQARSVADVLLNDPNVRVARGFGNFQELFIIRGFPAYSDDMTYNGIYGILPRQFVASEFMERVELFRGASAFLNGAAPGGSNLGGTVNLVPKRAPDEGVGAAHRRIRKFRRSLLRRRLRSSIRIRQSDRHPCQCRASVTASRRSKIRKRELKVLSFGIDHEGEHFRLAADIGYQDHRIDEPRPSVTPFGGIPEPPDADSQLRPAVDLHGRGTVVRRRAGRVRLERGRRGLGRLRHAPWRGSERAGQPDRGAGRLHDRRIDSTTLVKTTSLPAKSACAGTSRPDRSNTASSSRPRCSISSPRTPMRFRTSSVPS